METQAPKWVKTMDDGVLPFKNVDLNFKETDKEEKANEDEYKHCEDNIFVDFSDSSQKYNHGSKYFHSEMGVFCTVTDRVENEDGELKEIKVRLEGLDSEAVIPSDPEQLKTLKKVLPITFRIVRSTGGKLSLEGDYDISMNYKENIKNIFKASGLSPNSFKIFKGEKLLEKDTEAKDLFIPGTDNYLYAFETKVEAKKWMRFKEFNDSNEWYNSGSPDAVMFVPKQNVTITGFIAFAAKHDPSYQLKYRVEVDGRTVEESGYQVYTDWEDKYYKSIIFKNEISVSANSKIDIIESI